LSNSKKILNFIHKTGLTRNAQSLFPDSLTVLNYHRIDILENNLSMFQPNISATPKMFEQQMEFISNWYHVISLQELNSWLLKGTPLPPHAALITFDDGYLDNYTNAFPILKKFDFPAVIYLTSGYIASNRPFYWDLASYCFFYTQTDFIKFPDYSEKKWQSDTQKKEVLKAWIEAMKVLSEDEKQLWVEKLPSELRVSIPRDLFKNVMLTWEQIIEMRSSKIEFGAHTINHPILTRISLEDAKKEIVGSKEKIEKEIGDRITSFAYPNGMKADFNNAIASVIKGLGFQTAFTLLSGPTFKKTVRKSPYTIRRIFLSHKHTLQHFSILMSPFNRIRSI
jgi:peptidoglycan/xylan/chitin deacetylase (PgdA/CDA1 family)